MAEVLTRKCFDCSLEKPLTAFNADRTRKLGVEYRCRECNVAKLKNRDNSYYNHIRDQKHGWKNKVRSQTKRAFLNGKLAKLPCRECGDTNVQAHHPDYAKPLEVIWLCWPHHAELHRIERNNTPQSKEGE